jgi:hypothetical protein
MYTSIGICLRVELTPKLKPVYFQSITLYTLKPGYDTNTEENDN